MRPYRDQSPFEASLYYVSFGPCSRRAVFVSFSFFDRNSTVGFVGINEEKINYKLILAWDEAFVNVRKCSPR